MNKKSYAFVNSIMVISLVLGGISTADAKRFGGGNSFGSKSSYSAPVKRVDLPPSNRIATPPPPASRPTPNNQPQQTNSNQAWKDRAMGAAAGLAVGGLVGSMMGGNTEQPAQQQNPAATNNQNYAQPPAPMQNQQNYAPAPMQQNQGYSQPAPYANNTGSTHSSGGFSFLYIILLGGLGYLAYRFFFAKKTPSVQQQNYQYANTPAYSPAVASSSSADFNTDIMFKKGDTSVSSSKVNLAKVREIAIPIGFDKVAFLDEVKSRYMQLQQAWNGRDFAEIRGLTTDKVFAEIQDQLKSSMDVNNTDILKLDADLLEIREVNSEFEAVVLFDSIMREEDGSQANQVREVWHFVKSKSGFHANWMLDGIQQLQD